MSLTIRDWQSLRRALAQGLSMRAAAERSGVNRETARLWARLEQPPDYLWRNMLRNEGGPPAGRSARARLTYADRCRIAAMRDAGASNRAVAARLGVSPSTVGRELSRCAPGAYDPDAAHEAALRAARRPRPRKLDADPALRAYVVNGLMLRWSPEQVSRRIRRDFPDNVAMRVSHETIYQSLYVQGRGGLRHELGVQLSLRSGRARRKPQSRLPRRPDKPWLEGRHVSQRPAEAADRAVPGHWEGDLVVGGDMSSCLVTLVERTTRFALVSRLLARDAQTVEERLVEMVSGLPLAVARSVTWDQGAEMARAADFELATGFRVYFCDPRSPWQRGTNENTNGLIREFFPKGTRFSEVTDEEVARVQWLLNGRPRKALGWRTPAEEMEELLGGQLLQ